MDRPSSIKTERFRGWVRQHRLECAAGFGGAMVAVILLGPGLRRGALVNLDQVILRRVAMPDSIFGIGPQLPRRAPFTALVSSFAPLGWSDIAAKLLIVAMFATAAIGMARLCRRRGTAIAISVGVLYVASPLLLTRVVVGHLGLVWAAAWLPWLLAEVCRNRPRLVRVFWMGAGIACGGYLAGSLALLLAAAVLIGRFGRLGWALCWRIGVTQAIWFVPGAAIASVVRFNQPSSADFTTRLTWPSAPLRLFAGDGFFHPEAYAAPPSGVLGLSVGAVILALSVVGVIARVRGAGIRVSAESSRAGIVVGRRVGAMLLVSGFALTFASITPGVRGIWPDLTAMMPLSLFREGQRAFLVAWLVICPAVAWGLAWIATRWSWASLLASVTPIALALVLVGPSAWGANGQLEPVQLPVAWEQARNAIRRNPGTTLVLPIAQYFREPAADRRRTHQLFPYFVGGDVAFSSDDGSEEVDRTAESWQQDPRITWMLSAVSKWGFDRTELAPAVAEIGARYVVILDAPGAQLYVPLFDEPGFKTLLKSPHLVLLQVRPLVTDLEIDGVRPVETYSPWPGILSASAATAGERAPWSAAAGRGWMSGVTSMRVNSHGLAVVPPGTRWIWFWPALATQLVWAVLIAFGALQMLGAWRRRRRTR